MRPADLQAQAIQDVTGERPHERRAADDASARADTHKKAWDEKRGDFPVVDKVSGGVSIGGPAARGGRGSGAEHLSRKKSLLPSTVGGAAVVIA